MTSRSAERRSQTGRHDPESDPRPCTSTSGRPWPSRITCMTHNLPKRRQPQTSADDARFGAQGRTTCFAAALPALSGMPVGTTIFDGRRPALDRRIRVRPRPAVIRVIRLLGCVHRSRFSGLGRCRGGPLRAQAHCANVRRTIAAGHGTLRARRPRRPRMRYRTRPSSQSQHQSQRRRHDGESAGVHLIRHLSPR